jgi:rod shape-determining protein MreC
MYLKDQRKNHKITKPVQILSVIIISALFIILLFHWTPASIVLESIQSKLYSASITMNKFVVQIFTPNDSLRSEIEYYKELASNALIDKAYVDGLESRISNLEDILNYKQKVNYDFSVARILSKSRTNELSLLIDKGARDGIEIGLAAVVGGGHLIGLIDTVSEYTSSVQLLEDPKTSIPVSIINNDSPSGLLIGQGGYLLKMQFIPQDRDIKIGDIVVTSNLFEYVPNGLIIGAVKEVIEDESSPFKEAVIEPVYKATDYSDILIIKSSNVTIYEK